MVSYPSWFSYPADQPPPGWVHGFVDVVARARPMIDSTVMSGVTSDQVLSYLRPGLLDLGYDVEGGKKGGDKIRRPVLFGEQGAARVTYDVDAVHDALGIVVEVEAGRGARSNAAYRDLVRTSLIVGARFLVLGMMLEYRSATKGGVSTAYSYRDTKDQLDAVFASGRLALPFEGVLLFGY